MKLKNVLLVCHAGFPQNSAVHVHYFANGLVNLGLDCVVAVPHHKNEVSTVGHNLYKVIQFDEIDRLTELFDNQQGPDIVHAWTPREPVRKFCTQLEERFRFKLIIHLEDNEERILEVFAKRSIEALDEFNSDLIPPGLSHPKKHREFLESADGATVIMDRLKEFVPDRIPTATLWPGVDFEQFFPRPANANLVKELGIAEGSTVICYTGNVHSVNFAEVRGLYLAVGKRNLQHKPTVLVRTGINDFEILHADEAWIRQHTIELGFVDRSMIADLLALADVLVQPGESDRFNDYRFPSKIPEFLAMGKPVILPATNIGRFLTDRKNAIVLPVVNETSLSDAIDLVVQNPILAQTLSEGAWQFAKAHLDWNEKSQNLKTFYEKLLIEQNETVSFEQAFGRMQRQAQDLRTELNQTQIRLQHVEAALATAQTQLQQTQGELCQTQGELCQTQAQLQHTEAALTLTQTTIAAMETSKFWQLRTVWMRLKHRFGLKD